MFGFEGMTFIRKDGNSIASFAIEFFVCKDSFIVPPQIF